MATTFLDLPDELILRIAELLVAVDQSNLRLLSKKVDYLISPGLFETLHFSAASTSSPEKYTSLSEYIDLGKELVFSRCTKKMDIGISDAYPIHRYNPWLKLLDNLVPTLVNLQSLRWSHWPRKHLVSPLVHNAFNSFGSIPSLRELILRVVVFTPFPGFTLQSFSNLSSVIVTWGSGADVSQDMISNITDLLGRCPNLEQFTFNIPRPYHPSQVPVFTHLFAGLPPAACLKLRQLDLTGLHVSADDFRAHLRHLSTLKVLRLMFNRRADSPEQNDQICRILLENSIYLDELTIDTTHPAGVLEYLSSYSGLERLTFRSRYPGTDTPEGVHHFFYSVIPLHSATLRELHLGWAVETLWTKDITSEDLAQLEKCQRLRDLSCSVTITIGSAERTDRLLGAWLEAAMKLPLLRYLTFFPTCRGHPPLHDRDGRFYYDQHTMHDFNLTVQNDKFGMERIEKLKAGRVVPFKILVASPTLGR